MKITAEKPKFKKPKVVKVSVSGFRPFYLTLEGEETAAEVFAAQMSVELESKQRPVAKPKAKRERKPKASQTETVAA